MNKFLVSIFAIFILCSCVSSKEEKENTIKDDNLSAAKEAIDNRFFGVLTIDNFNVEKCSVVEIGDSIQYSSYFRAAQENKFNNKDNFLQTIIEYTELMPEKLKAVAVNKGFNVVLGYKLIPVTHYNGFGSSIINGMDGVGYGVVIGQGTPAKVICKK